MLDKDMIKEPRMWQLVMEVSPDALSVMAFSPIEHHTLISEEIPLSNTATSPLKGFQEAVYDNPLLLADFRKTTILLPTPRAMLVPDILTDTSRREQAFREAFPPSGADGPEEILAEELPALGATMLTAINREFLGFLRRTFNNPRISHTLTPLALYFKAKHPTRPHGKMIANLRQGRCDIVILGDKAPMVMNSYPVRDPMDSVYYIMACREAFGLSATDELILAGDNASRGAHHPGLAAVHPLRYAGHLPLHHVPRGPCSPPHPLRDDSGPAGLTFLVRYISPLTRTRHGASLPQSLSLLHQ